MNRNVLITIGVVIVLAIAIAWLLRVILKLQDGFDEKGQFDSEVTHNTEGGYQSFPTGMSSPTFAEKPISLNYFKISDFDSKGDGEKGSGVKMRVTTLQMLEKARSLSGIPFTINSGFRTVRHNQEVKGVPDSAHTQGYAVDISAITKSKQVAMLKALHEVGFRRFGIYKTFIHVDNDPDKPTPSIWAKGGATIHYNPLNA